MIKDLYYGNISRSEQTLMTEKRKKLTEYSLELSREFEKTLTEEQKQSFIRFMDSVNECSSDDLAEMYETGFCDGMSVMMDYMKHNER